MYSNSGFGAFQASMQIQRKPINPYDKTTLVSNYPKPIIVEFVTIFPCYFEIPAAKDGPITYTIGSSSAFRFMGENQPYLEIPINSWEVSDSIIKKFASGLQECDMAGSMPAIFRIPGEHDLASLKKYVSPEMKDFASLLKDANSKQIEWYKRLVKTADVLWSRTNGNPLTISDDARMAAEILKLDKPWMKDQKIFELSSCPACGSMVNTAFPVCSNCKTVINKEKAKELGLEFAK